MGQFSLPAADTKYSSVIDTFLGVDLLNSPSNVDIRRSPEAPNMIRDQVGKVRKRMGYTTAQTWAGQKINGHYQLNGEHLYHVGTKLYKKNGDVYTKVSANMADTISTGFVFGEKLYLLTGAYYLVYDGLTVGMVASNAYIPTILISKNPSGGGTVYEGLNLIGSGWTETFLGNGTDTVYQLSTTDLDAQPVTVVKVLDENGDWQTKTQGTDYTVNRADGTITFTTAPPVPPVTGMDNVSITAHKAREGYADKINHCTICVTYGVGGAADRVFFSGGDQAGMDWYSGYKDPTYIPDINYTQLSQDGSKVVGYCILNGTLATMLDNSADGRNAVIRTGSLDENGEALFRITNTLIGEAAVAPRSFLYLGKEPMFFTRRGVYAITAEELTGEKYTQERSYYISSKLQEAANKETAVACIYRDFYALALDGDLYLLDSLQKSYQKNSPYSSYQMEGYYWPDIGARTVWTEDETLCFGTADGRICRFGNNVDDPEAYNDDGAAITAYWDTPDLDGNSFFKNKTFTSVSVRLASAVLTGVKIYAQRRGIWESEYDQVFDARERARYFDWSYLDFAKFTFSTDRTPRTLVGKVKLKKVDKVRFRLKNEELNEPFGLYLFGVEWREPGSNYKR